jgi:hypothetical protein
MNVGQKCQASLEKQSNGGVVFDGWEKGRYDSRYRNFSEKAQPLPFGCCFHLLTSQSPLVAILRITGKRRIPQ